MFKCPYDTFLFKGFNRDSIYHQLDFAKIQNELVPLSVDGKSIENLFGLSPKNETIELFSHPLVRMDKDLIKIYIDTRPFTRLDRDGLIVISQKEDYLTQLNRGIASLEFINYPQNLLSMGDLVFKVFCLWIMRPSSRVLNLSINEQLQLITISLYYWFSLFKNEPLEEREIRYIQNKLNVITRIPLELSNHVIIELEPMKNIEDFTKLCKKIIKTPRMDKFNPLFLYTLLGNSWFGINIKEQLAVALEHPPTFINFVYSAVISRSYQRTILGQLVKESDKNQLGSEFSKRFQSMSKNYLK